MRKSGRPRRSRLEKRQVARANASRGEVRSKMDPRASNRLSPFHIHQPSLLRLPLTTATFDALRKFCGSATARSVQPFPLPPTRNILRMRPCCRDRADSVKVSSTLILSRAEDSHHGTPVFPPGGLLARPGGGL